MLAIFWVLLAIFLGAFWSGLRCPDDEVYFLVASLSGIVIVVWGFLLIPLPWELLLCLGILGLEKRLFSSHFHW